MTNASEFREGVMQALKVIDLPEGRPPLALDLPGDTTFDEWVAIGRRLCLGSQALQWHIGDWWAFGDHRYGDRAKAAAEGLFGREFGSLMNLATVARTFETSRRREHLTFTHHVEVASLPAETAEELLEKAEREHLSTRDLRREVQAIRVANDPQPGPVEVEPEPRASKPIPSQTTRAELTVAYEMVIEFAEALQQLRPLTRRETDLLATAMTFVDEAHSGHRPCPEDFEVIFVEQGRLACETWYGASRLTVNRWLIERGKSRLIAKRAEFVRFQREQLHPQSAVRETVAVRPIDVHLHALAKEAASFLRVSRYGGWMITETGDGDWRVGTVRKTADELIAMAERQGFDSEAARKEVDAE
jgi:hypothetical protein